MGDSVKVLTQPGRKYHATPGHIHKGGNYIIRPELGHSIVAANASIPTKFQTIITHNSDKKGFLRQGRRFKEDEFMTEAPPPGIYVGMSKVDKISPSFSKKGTGSFASKSKRQVRYTTSSGPGPGIYALPSMLSTRKDFNRSHVERLFQPPIAQTQEKEHPIPAPNTYEVLKYKHGKANNVTANAAFKSQTKREVMNLSAQKSNPAPGHYEPVDNQLHESVKIPFSSFKSTSKRTMLKNPNANPGPGAYNPESPVEQPAKLIFPRKHYLCISAPAMPLPSTPPAPGPGAYEVRNFEDAPKHYMSSSAFVSTTGRWVNQTEGQEIPGPAHYRPVNVGKQSFIFNSTRKWI